MNEKQGSSFAHFLYFSNPIDPLNQLCTESLTESLSVGIDFTDVTLASEDTYLRLYWCDPDDPDEPDDHDDPDESYLVMKVI